MDVAPAERFGNTALVDLDGLLPRAIGIGLVSISSGGADGGPDRPLVGSKTLA